MSELSKLQKARSVRGSETTQGRCTHELATEDEGHDPR